jgi:hypothetical protein
MTPKEKAKQLVDRMYFTISNNGQFTGVHSIPNKFAEAKKCASIAVYEIIESVLPSSDFGGDINKNTVEYWKEVKQEIENYD